MMSSPLPIPIGTLCIKIASAQYPEHVGELCTVVAYIPPGVGMMRDGSTNPHGWAYMVEYDNPAIILPDPFQRWMSPPEQLKPVPPAPEVVPRELQQEA